MYQRCQINIYQNNITSSLTFTVRPTVNSQLKKKKTRNARVQNGKLDSHSKKLTAWSCEKTGRGKNRKEMDRYLWQVQGYIKYFLK